MESKLKLAEKVCNTYREQNNMQTYIPGSPIYTPHRIKRVGLILTFKHCFNQSIIYILHIKLKQYIFYSTI